MGHDRLGQPSPQSRNVTGGHIVTWLEQFQIDAEKACPLKQ
jgi:hypothetical protein